MNQPGANELVYKHGQGLYCYQYLHDTTVIDEDSQQLLFIKYPWMLKLNSYWSEIS